MNVVLILLVVFSTSIQLAQCQECTTIDSCVDGKVCIWGRCRDTGKPTEASVIQKRSIGFKYGYGSAVVQEAALTA
ncbi:hypothetical protein GCK72_019546 [Caenorhabditis remanei]|uniref:Uncharacterized protein n=2 Tax=Caenorhabditis remanei TaxID=31234 RepID=E3LLA7_CAERE|nr:hypothetical protein GCK72_019546 [Caenorhabditis remanei]EFP00022.1 hypothetical protein CRE_18701 [Caenorhabditis remanei]KAF1752991.1 hypothetical protein GCK72_019546 [Caenorhabditis remanei]